MTIYLIYGRDADDICDHSFVKKAFDSYEKAEKYIESINNTRKYWCDKYIIESMELE